MRKTITGTGGMLLIQTLKDAGVEYLFTNPGSAETGIFAALVEDDEQRLVVGKHEGLVAAMADGYSRLSGKVGVIIAHVMGGSYQLAGQLFNAQVAGSSLLVIARAWASEIQGYRGLAPFPTLTQAETMRPLPNAARAASPVAPNPAATNVPTREPLGSGMYPASKDFGKVTGRRPDVSFMVGCQGVHGSVAEPFVIQIGPNPVLMGRHYPLDIAAQCEVPEALRGITAALR